MSWIEDQEGMSYVTGLTINDSVEKVRWAYFAI
jgi:hypothetical protein